MKKIIPIMNQKGGVGKSSTAHALGFYLKNKKNKILFIDLDGQGNMSHTLNQENLTDKNSFELLSDENPITKNYISTYSGVDVIYSSPYLAGADGILTDTGKEFKLKEAIEQIKGDYDYIIIDTPPSLGILTINALTASDDVIIPAQADIYSLQGITQIANTISTVKKYCNNNLKIKGLIITRYNARTVLSNDISEMINEMAENLNSKLYKPFVRECIAIKEAQANKEDIFAYAPKSNASYDYKLLFKEIMKGDN